MLSTQHERTQVKIQWIHAWITQVGERWMWRQTWAQVDLDRLRHNVAVIRAQVGERVRIMASVKANAYGHGAVAVSRALLSAGVYALGVATVEEAVELREADITAPILCYGAMPPDAEEVMVRRNIAATVMNRTEIARLAQAAVKLGRTAEVHVKVDTGMGRLGVRGEAEAVRLLQVTSCTAGVHLQGVYTHFSSADEPLAVTSSETRRQAHALSMIVTQARELGVAIPLVHAANSAALFRDPSFHFDMVRPGIALYGYHPLASADRKQALQPVLSLFTRVVRVAELSRGEGVSYGRTFVCERDEQIATLPVGYADGLPRALSNAGHVDFAGHAARIAGRVCMDQMMIVTTGLRAQVGDLVRIYGDDEGGIASLAHTATRLGTIPYELLCAISGRVPRMYV